MLEGELGSGKTTLVKSLGRLMGVLDNITSPTFSIVNEYETTSGDIIYHFDFYRIRDLGEASALGLDEYLDSGRLCLIEWPEIVKRLLPEHNLQVRIETSRDDSRIFHLTRNE